MSLFNSEQRRWWADKLGEIAVFTITALIINQLVNEDFRLSHTLIGLALAALFFGGGHSILKPIK